jgi:PHD-like zinc-binding domain
MQKISGIELGFLANERETQIPDDYSFFLQRNEAAIESACAASELCFVPTQYEWIHLSCATWLPGPLVTPKTPVRLNKIDEKRFSLQCIICLKKEGACMQCQSPRCQIAFHIECARRANYCMEIERKTDTLPKDASNNNGSSNLKGDARQSVDKTYKIFCEKHRPLKIVKEMEERDL